MFLHWKLVVNEVIPALLHASQTTSKSFNLRTRLFAFFASWLILKIESHCDKARNKSQCLLLLLPLLPGHLVCQAWEESSD